jgi:hypothetical protein
MSRLGRVSVALIVMLLVAGLGVGTAAAAPPSNDTEAGAIDIGSLPFNHSQDTSGATADGPRFCASQASVFYTFTPDAASRLQVDLIGSEYDTTLGVYTRRAGGDVHQITCSDDRFGLASGVRFRAEVGVTYFLIVSQCCGSRGSSGGGGPLVLTAAEVTNIELDYSFQVNGGTTDPDTGLTTLRGTVTCNDRSLVYREASLRQLRQGIFVARVFIAFSVACTPGPPVGWSWEVDTDTGIAFGPGTALLRSWYEQAGDGWRDSSFTNSIPDVSITLQ